MSSLYDRQAIIAAKVYLEMRGYKIIELNWHRSRNKIDIVAEKSNVIYLVEVKYHRTDHLGAGAAITKSKLQELNAAAETWLEENKWHGTYVHAAVEVAGTAYTIMSFIDNVSVV